MGQRMNSFTIQPAAVQTTIRITSENSSATAPGKTQNLKSRHQFNALRVFPQPAGYLIGRIFRSQMSTLVRSML
jgi:hypothetical protein